jgi:probable DNA metabolism protein
MGMMNDLLTEDLFLADGRGGAGKPQSVMLQCPVDWPGFRRAARRLLAQQVAPELVSWHSGSTRVQDLFAGTDNAAPEAPAPEAGNAPAIHVPPEFLTLCQSVILHSDPNRFGLLYRLLWRLVHEPGLRHDPLDADRVRAEHLAQAVRRDMHKMNAFVRFTSVQDESLRALYLGARRNLSIQPHRRAAACGVVRARAPYR